MVVVHKPAGMASQPGKTPSANVLETLAGSLDRDSRTLHLVSRLDQPVEGLMMVMLSSDCSSEVIMRQSNEKMKKHYLAIVCGEPSAHHGSLHNILERDGRINRSGPAIPGSDRGRQASLNWEKIAVREISDSDGTRYRLSLLDIGLETGRHHQIRVQFALAGLPIWGDRKYNTGNLSGRVSSAGHLDSLAATVRNSGIALISWKLELLHPVTGQLLYFELPFPDRMPFQLFQPSNDSHCDKMDTID